MNRVLGVDAGLAHRVPSLQQTPYRIRSGRSKHADRGNDSGAKLDAHLARFVRDGRPTIDGFAVWSYQQTGVVEWKTLARWAESLQARACVARSAS